VIVGEEVSCRLPTVTSRCTGGDGMTEALHRELQPPGGNVFDVIAGCARPTPSSR